MGSDGCKNIRQKSLPPPLHPFRWSRPFPWLGSSHHLATLMVDGPRGTPAPSPSALTQQANCAKAGPRASFSTEAPRTGNIPVTPCGRGRLLWQNPQGRHWGSGFSAASRPDRFPPPGRPSVSSWEWSPRATQWRAWITAPTSQFSTSYLAP